MAISLAPLFAMALTLYVGTYTDPQGSKGIYRTTLNLETGALSEAELAAETPAPSYIALRSDGKFLYAVNEFTDGEASAFAVENGSLRKLNTVKFDGKGPCHLSLDTSGKWLFVAGSSGTLNALPILEDGSLGPGSGHFQSSGGGPNKDRQEGPHMHFASQVGKYLYACNLGTDEVLTFPADGRLGKPISSCKSPPGSGPRHFVVSRDEKTLYVNNEMGMSVSVFDRNPANGQLRLVETVSTLQEGGPTKGMTTAAIRLHPRLPVLYVSNRGANSLAVFDVKPDGLLHLRSVVALPVNEPRDFDIDPSGRWLIVAGQKSGELVSLKLDEKTGLPGEVAGRCKVSKPVCVRLLDH